MKIGTFYSGTIAEFNGQSIKSKFVIIGIPLFPISSFYFVNKTQGMKLPLVGKSARIGMGRTLCTLIASVLFVVLAAFHHYPNIGVKILTIAGTVIFTGIALYSWLSGQNMPEEEKNTRLILEKTITYNMLPSLLPKDTRISIMQSTLMKLDNKYSDFFMRPNYSISDFDKRELPFLYTLCLYMSTIKENKYAIRFLENNSSEKILTYCV